MPAFPKVAVCAALIALAAPTALSAQDAAVPDSSEEAITQLSDTLSDPDFQAQMSAVAEVLLSSMLDLEVGSMMAAVDEASGGAVSEKGGDIDPDARLRDIAPEADEIPEQVSEKLPQMMTSMAIMSDGMAEMLPALKAMAKRMRGALEEAQTAQ